MGILLQTAGQATAAATATAATAAAAAWVQCLTMQVMGTCAGLAVDVGLQAAGWDPQKALGHGSR
jgi:hypothetical protein